MSYGLTPHGLLPYGDPNSAFFNTYAVSVSESGTLADGPSVTLTIVGSVPETGTLSESLSSILIALSAAAEAGTLLDGPSSLAVMLGNLVEAGMLSEATLAAIVSTNALADTSNLVDICSASGVWSNAAVEAGFLLDDVQTVVPTYTDQFPLLGGRYGIAVVADPFNAGLIELNIMAADGARSVATSASFHQNGYKVVDLPPGQYRFMIYAATDVAASVTRMDNGLP